MAEINDIKDRESLEAWLLAQPEAQIKPFAIAISARVALRVSPRMWRWTVQSERAREKGITALPFLRCYVVSTVASHKPSVELRQAAYAAANAAFAFAEAFGFAAADAAAAAADVADAAFAAAAAVFAAADFSTDIWAEVRKDCEALQAGPIPENWPLWAEDRDPFADLWAEVKAGLGDTAKDWQFWIDWYESMLHGAPQNIDMLEEIALIDDAVWKNGPEAVNAAIAGIRLKYAVLATPNAEVMSINPDTGKLRVDPLTGMPRDHLQEAVEKLENVLDLFDFETAGANQYSSLMDEWKIIDKAVQKYGQRPRMLHSACVRVERRLRIKIDAGECPEPEKDANVWDFLTTVQAVSVDLFTRDPHVKEAATHAAATKLPELDAAQIETLFKAADELAENAEDVLQEEAPQHARDMVDPALSEGARKEAFYITASRMLRAWVLTGYRGSKAALEEVESVTKTIAGITKNIAVISTSGAVVSAPLWLGQAVDIIVKYLS